MSADPSPPLGLFAGYGIEIEYAIADRRTLDVRPVADRALRAAAGAQEWVGDFEDGAVAWSNELVRHALEIKTNGPAPSFAGLAVAFTASLRRMDATLREVADARLLPGGIHPWMVPARETELWPHEYGEVYAAYDKIYDCRRHGWANVQSTHLNLPFADEEEFARLLAAVRLVLPLIPALAASSPIVEGRASGLLDARLEFYRTNSSRTPSMTGEVIPEPIYGIDDYRRRVLAPIRGEVAALDTSGALGGNEWTNARGAIARFDRMAIEVRLIDAQECASADLALAAAVAGLVRHLTLERSSSLAAQQAFPSAPLVALLARTAHVGPAAPLFDHDYARLFAAGLDGYATAGDLWRLVAPDTFLGGAELEPALEVALREGPLAERLLAALGAARGGRYERERLREVWTRLADGLLADESFVASA